nr:hypothetical protein GCM10020063_047120 [Dactylosporangium thailandense]
MPGAILPGWRPASGVADADPGYARRDPLNGARQVEGVPSMAALLIIALDVFVIWALAVHGWKVPA